jgi:hypothetical protein
VLAAAALHRIKVTQAIKNRIGGAGVAGEYTTAARVKAATTTKLNGSCFVSKKGGFCLEDRHHHTDV